MSDAKVKIAAQLQAVQSKLKAPKGQTNNFGGYKYRSLEDICEAVKPLLAEQGLILTFSDEAVLLGENVYIKCTATVSNGEEEISTTAFAREADSKKGMDTAQVSGSTSSYVRKYAANGLLLIDDTKDADASNTHGKTAPAAKKQAEPKAEKVEAPKKTNPNNSFEPQDDDGDDW